MKADQPKILTDVEFGWAGNGDDPESIYVKTPSSPKFGEWINRSGNKYGHYLKRLILCANALKNLTNKQVGDYLPKVLDDLKRLPPGIWN